MAVIIVELVRTRGTEDDQASNTGALEKVVEQPFGRVLLTIVAIGVAGYALWRFAEAWLNRDDKAIDRVANVARGLVYVGLLVTSIRILTHSRSSGQDGSGDQQVDTILDWPAGRWIVGAIALVVFGIAVYNLGRAVTGKWREDLDIGGLSRRCSTRHRDHRLGGSHRSHDRLRARRLVPPPCRRAVRQVRTRGPRPVAAQRGRRVVGPVRADRSRPSAWSPTGCSASSRRAGAACSPRPAPATRPSTSTWTSAARRSPKNAVSSAAARSASTPWVTGGLWLSRGSAHTL